jgi:hypothetical protein
MYMRWEGKKYKLLQILRRIDTTMHEYDLKLGNGEMDSLGVPSIEFIDGNFWSGAQPHLVSEIRFTGT